MTFIVFLVVSEIFHFCKAVIVANREFFRLVNYPKSLLFVFLGEIFIRDNYQYL